MFYQQAICHSSTSVVQLTCSNDIWPNHAYWPISFEQHDLRPSVVVMHQVNNCIYLYGIHPFSGGPR